MRAKLNRVAYGQKQTIGKMYNLDDNDYIQAEFDTLELPWQDNKTFVSCIPEGNYSVITRYSKSFGSHFHLKNVVDRTYILIHKGNFYTDIEGCIIIGKDLSDIDNDGLVDVQDSAKAMQELKKIFLESFELEITS